ncbi:amidohydrolase family protein [Streptomyces sp. So13.3]|uniref:amidohydrolase family protein n=1 Tax=Streptomyces TaxID=1883 RepID=UPI00110602E5|nr:amidohydrolase family protein [Streptomyces sp. So13.3]QNA76292.1 amidohydrolase family protein [Streptomyces sp. So13.3]
MPTHPPHSADRPKTALVNVRVFDGQRLVDGLTVVIDGPLIGTDPTGAHTVDCGGATLLPGLIDSHVHLHGPKTLEQLANYGVTTALDMGAWPPALVASLRNARGLTDIRSAGGAAVAPGSHHAHIPTFPKDGIVTGPADAERFVAARIAEGVDYIKIIAEKPGPSGTLNQATLEALTAAARAHGKRSIAHASSFEAIVMARQAGVDVITHVPLDRAIDEAEATQLASAGTIAVPTLSMMEPIARNGAPGRDYAQARASVAALHQAGVPILAGTDANTAPGVPANVPHGSSMHHELELLVDAGLSTIDALRAGTLLPAHYFALHDRGTIAPGQRADLLLIDGDPTTDIRATRQIQRIWCAGIEHIPTPA